jgi:hypothetical protein
VKNISGMGSESLLQLLHENRSGLSSNDRDKIFALLGLMADVSPYTHLIDYTAPVEDIYLNLAWQVLQDTQSLRLLSAAGEGFSSVDSSKSRNKHMPSWVPDWSCESPVASFALGKTFAEPFNAGGRHCMFTVKTNEKHLNVRGVRLATITRVSDPPAQDYHGFLAEKSLKSWKAFSASMVCSIPHNKPLVVPSDGG